MMKRFLSDSDMRPKVNVYTIVSRLNAPGVYFKLDSRADQALTDFRSLLEPRVY